MREENALSFDDVRKNRALDNEILGGGRLCQHGIDVTKRECIHCIALAEKEKAHVDLH